MFLNETWTKREIRDEIICSSLRAIVLVIVLLSATLGVGNFGEGKVPVEVFVPAAMLGGLMVAILRRDITGLFLIAGGLVIALYASIYGTQALHPPGLILWGFMGVAGSFLIGIAIFFDC